MRRWRWRCWLPLLGSPGGGKFAKSILVACLLAAPLTHQFLTLRGAFVREGDEILNAVDLAPPPFPMPVSKRRDVGKGGINNGSSTTNEDEKKDNENFMGEQVPVREFPKWDRPFPCAESVGRGGAGGAAGANNGGLFYIKTPKCASSTLAGIARRMAIRNHPANVLHVNVTGTTTTDIRQTCRVHSRHSPAYKISGLALDRRRDPDHSYLYAFVRDPTKRFISDFYHFQVSRNGVEPTDDALIRYITGGFARNHRCCGHFAAGMGGFQFPYLLLPPPTSSPGAGGSASPPPPASTGSASRLLPMEPHTYWHPDRPNEVRNHTHLVDAVDSVLSSYDFVGTVERLDESLVVLSFLLFGHLRADHILYLPSKVSGGYDDGRFKNKCHYIQQPEPGRLDPDGRVGSYLASAEWRARVAGDELLHAAANASLDRTIENVIGRDVFYVALAQFRAVLRLARERCTNETVRFPCGWDGTRNDVTDCYDGGDEGCGHECLDRVYESFVAAEAAAAAAAADPSAA